MKQHAFYNLIEGTINLAHLKNGIWIYPDDFIQRYNASIDRLNDLKVIVNEQIAIMTKLEQEQFKYVAGSINKKESKQ